jgi:LacI family transcriptional regulator, repressor for deo operon, udp, cdd, tsx, nupC, and nupG
VPGMGASTTTSAGPAKPPTIRQVAALAGVSHQTVSRYLRADSTLLPATLEKVKAAVAELDYRPNLFARSMRTRRSGMLAVVLPGWVGAERSLAAACSLAEQEGFRVEIVIGLGEGPRALAERVRDLLTGGQVEGVLSLSPLEPLADLRGRVLQTGDYDDRLRAVEAVAEDAGLVREIVRGLADLGHRHLLHAAGPQDFTSARIRRTAYLEACEEFGLRSHGDSGGRWHPETGVAALSALPEKTKVTAVVAANDQIATGVVHAARARGWDVPDRLSVTGWDDLELGRYAHPALSTVSVDRETAGRYAMARLIAGVRGRPDPEPPAAPLGRVQFRETTGPAPARRKARG